jgi:hypothetical protein
MIGEAIEMAPAVANKPIPNGRWLRIIPPAIIVYIVAYMDRMNIGFAMAGGMNESLGISMTISGLAAGIFFFGYMVLQIPGGHLAEHGSAKKFIAWTIIAWGVVSTLTGFVQNEWQLLTMRFLLGVAEGGLLAGDSRRDWQLVPRKGSGPCQCVLHEQPVCFSDHNQSIVRLGYSALQLALCLHSRKPDLRRATFYLDVIDQRSSRAGKMDIC